MTREKKKFRVAITNRRLGRTKIVECEAYSYDDVSDWAHKTFPIYWYSIEIYRGES